MLSIRYPAPLLAGGRIAITAPSAGVEASMQLRLELCIEGLRTQGFVVEEGECLRRQQQDTSAPAEVRAAELMHYLLRDDIGAIIPPWGGELAIELLELLDWHALAHARPKWLLGYSDTSTLQVALTLRLGWATAHGPCLMDLVAGQNDSLTARAMSALATPAGGQFEQFQSARWQARRTDFAIVPDVTYSLTEPTHWRCLNRSAGNVVRFGGRLIGGCLDTLMHTAGTPYGDLRRFIADAGSDGVILYFENAEQSPVDVVRALHRLRWAGWLDGVAGLVVGRSAAPDSQDKLGGTRLRYADALKRMLAGLPCPVLIDVDIGHLPPQLVLINGAKAQVSWSESGGGRVVQALT